jgi:formylglycine-generating enzyme required for sulfatase activity
VVQAIWLRRGEQRRLSMTVVPAPAGTAVVPGQPGVIAPFAIGVTEVTCGEWLAFINDAAVRAEISAAMGEGRLIRLPRTSHTSMEPLWRVRSSSLRSGGGHQVESTDGRAIDPASPVTGISAEDARAYAAWRATREGRPWRLPTLAEWRWAVGGGDGRLYPWGDAGDLGLCASAVTCAGLAQDVLPSVGSHPTDRSVQGVLDLAGSVAEFVDAGPEVIITVGGVRLTPLMGGSRYENQAERFTSRHRRDMDPRWVHPGAGFRLAQDL